MHQIAFTSPHFSNHQVLIDITFQHFTMAPLLGDIYLIDHLLP